MKMAAGVLSILTAPPAAQGIWAWRVLSKARSGEPESIQRLTFGAGFGAGAPVPEPAMGLA